jgi:hypothetical protein
MVVILFYFSIRTGGGSVTDARRTQAGSDNKLNWDKSRDVQLNHGGRTVDDDFADGANQPQVLPASHALNKADASMAHISALMRTAVHLYKVPPDHALGGT